MNLLVRPLRSSLGSKYVMAATGLALMGFVFVHMAGNLLIFAGPDALNSYAQALKARPALLWTGRLVLAAIFVVHVIVGVRLTRQNVAARPVRYACEATMQASWASRHMLLTGLVLLAFVVFHLAHFTLGLVHRADMQVVAGTPTPFKQPRNYLDLAEVRPPMTKSYRADPDKDLSQLDAADIDARHDVYSMVVAGFRNGWLSLSYLAAMAFLGLHLWHGGSSFFQSLGVNSPRYGPLLSAVGPLFALVIVVGNCSIVLAVWLGLL